MRTVCGGSAIGTPADWDIRSRVVFLGSNALLPCYDSLAMPLTEKISVAIGRDELRLAKTAAQEEGLSLSAFVTRAVRDRLEERRRFEAARAVLATFTTEDFPSDEERRDLIELWTRQRRGTVAAPKHGNARKRRHRAA
jgi:hypothetical protein